MRKPIEKIKARLEDIWEEAVLLERERESEENARVQAFEKGQQFGVDNCPVCFHRESGGTDEATLKMVIDEVKKEFPKNKKLIEFLSRLQ